MHTQESGKGMKKLRNNKIRKLLAFMVALALMVSCMPSAYTISASEAFGDGTEDIFTDGEITSEPAAEESTPDVSSADQEETEQAQQSTLTYENDSVTRIIQDDIDEKVYSKIRNKTIQEMREWILDDSTDSDKLMWASRGMTSEVIAGI